MSQVLETLDLKSRKINLDFSKNIYVSVTAKQYDLNSRHIIIQFTNNGETVKLDSSFKAELRMLTPDNREIIDDECLSIRDDGTVHLVLTDNMLHAPGKAVAEVRLYTLEECDSRMLSPMNFYVVVIASPFDEDKVLSSPDFKALVNLYEKMEKDYTYVITESRAYAALAEESETSAGASAVAAANSVSAAKKSETNAKTSEINAQNSANTAAESAAIAENKAAETSGHADLSRSYAVGTGGTVRDNDDIDNSQYYYEQAKRIAQGTDGIIYMGTITFSELSNQDYQEPRYMFNISDSFVTDGRFKEGAGHPCSAGTKVYRTADGYWEVFAGSASGVTGVKGNAEGTYRQGNVNITAKDIGVSSEVISASEPDNQDTGDYWLLAY